MQESAVLSAAEELKGSSHILSIGGGNYDPIQHNFESGKMFVFDVQPVPEAIVFPSDRFAGNNQDGKTYPTLNEFLEDCAGKITSKYQCVIFSGNKEDDSYLLGINSDDGYISHVKRGEGENEDETIDPQAGIYQLDQLSDGTTEIIRVFGLKSKYTDIYDQLADVVDYGQNPIFMLYEGKAAAGIERDWQQSRQEIIYDKNAYNDFVEGSGGDQLTVIVNNLPE